MPPTARLDSAAIDAQLRQWRQGDAFLTDEVRFVHVADIRAPATPQTRELAAENGTALLLPVATEATGFVVISQTCDIVRSAATHPFVSVSSLANVGEHDFVPARRAQTLRFAVVPALADRRLVAHLDHVMTVEKGVIAMLGNAARIPGCRTDEEARAFARILARRVERFAFPNEFVAAVRGIQGRVTEKCRKPSAEGQLYAAIREIRIECRPDWQSDDLTVNFLFVFGAGAAITTESEQIVEALMARFVDTGPFKSPTSRLLTLTDMTAERYLASDRLELDHLSGVTG